MSGVSYGRVGSWWGNPPQSVGMSFLKISRFMNMRMVSAKLKMRTVLLKVFSPWKAAQNVNQYEIPRISSYFGLQSCLFSCVHAETHDVRGFFGCLTFDQSAMNRSAKMHVWCVKTTNTLQKHPSLLSSKHSTSALNFCAIVMCYSWLVQ